MTSPSGFSCLLDEAKSSGLNGAAELNGRLANAAESPRLLVEVGKD